MSDASSLSSHIGASRRLSLAIVALAALGGLAAFALMLERLAVLDDPTYVPSCTLNPIVSCSSVMTSAQASLLGFPNPLIGIVGFPVAITTGAALLAGARLARWYWWGLQAGVTLATGLVHWLIFQSLYRIGALCPYCMVVWLVTAVLFVLITQHNLRHVSPGAPWWVRRAGSVVREYASTILVAWTLLIALLIAVRFWSYWITLVG